jgi:methyl-accepting chemotaxis protein
MKRSLSISKQVQLTLAAGTLALAAATALTAYNITSEMVATMADGTIAAAARANTRALKDYVGTLRDQGATFAGTSAVRDAVFDFDTAWSVLKTPAETLRKTYADNNPYPIEDRFKFLKPPGATDFYASAHAAHQPQIGDFVSLGRFFNVSIVNRDRWVIYSYRKTDYFATQLAPNDTYPAAKAANMVLEHPDDLKTVAFSGFVATPGWKNAYSAAFAYPIADLNGKLSAALVLTIATDRVAELMHGLTGKGAAEHTGLIFANGANFGLDALRSQGRPFDLSAGLLGDAMKHGTAAGTATLGPQEERLAAIRLDEGNQPVLVVSAIDDAAAMAPVALVLHMFVVVSVGVVAFISLIGLLITRRIMSPLVRLSGVVRRMAAGDYTVEVADAKRGDEVGDVARALAVFREGSLERDRLRAEEMARSQRQNHRQAELERSIGAFRGEVQALVASLVGGMRDMQQTADMLFGVAEETANEAAQAEAAALQTNERVGTVAQSSDELTASIHAISEQVRRTADSISEAAHGAAAADGQFSNLTTRVNEIAEIVNMIQGIAAQTNLLSLNATIEAARAGAAGRGFAVVASEVKALANETAKATEEISRRIEGFQQATREAGVAIKSIVGTAAKIDASTAVIATAINSQSSATTAIADNVESASMSTKIVQHSIEVVASGAAKTSRSANTMTSTSADVGRSVDGLRSAIERFLQTVEAA